MDHTTYREGAELSNSDQQGRAKRVRGALETPAQCKDRQSLTMHHLQSTLQRQRRTGMSPHLSSSNDAVRRVGFDTLANNTALEGPLQGATKEIRMRDTLWSLVSAPSDGSRQC